MPNNLCLFAIHADDLPKAKRFYERVFGWKIEPWGPPGFFLISTGSKKDPGVTGALQKRHEVVGGERFTGFECSVEVADVDATTAAVVANGGKIIMPKCEIPTVGWIVKFLDPDGNVVGMKQPSAEQTE